MRKKDFIYTYIVDFRGGTYCTQVKSNSIDKSLSTWLKNISNTRQEIKYLGDKTIDELNLKISTNDYRPTPLNGLINIWFTMIQTSNGPFYINIIKTDIK